MYDMVVVGLVHRLLEEWPEHDPVGPARSPSATSRPATRAARTAQTEQGVDMLIDYDPELQALTVEVMTSPGAALF